MGPAQRYALGRSASFVRPLGCRRHRVATPGRVGGGRRRDPPSRGCSVANTIVRSAPPAWRKRSCEPASAPDDCCTANAQAGARAGRPAGCLCEREQLAGAPRDSFSGKPAVSADRRRRLLPVGSSRVRNVDDGRQDPHVGVVGRLLAAGCRRPSKRFTGRLRRDCRLTGAMQQRTAAPTALPRSFRSSRVRTSGSASRGFRFDAKGQSVERGMELPRFGGHLSASGYKPGKVRFRCGLPRAT